MEVVVCTVLTTVWWMSSVSAFLPFVLLLKFSKSFRDRWFSWIFMRILRPVFEPKLLPLRRQAFQLLKQHLSHQDNALKVLEIGIGSGANLEFYPENSHLIAVDMNASFEIYFRLNKKKYPHVIYDRTVICMAENMKEVEDSSVDVVVSTYVLCSVQSQRAALDEIKRVLKPGGKFLFLEHVSFPKTEWSSTIQRLTSPLWSLYFDGCSLNRNTADEIRKTGFRNVICETVRPSSLMLYVRCQVMGIATK